MARKVLLATIGTRGDVQPFLALAVGLRATGHEVAICTCPRFAEFVAPWDVPLHALDEGLLDLLESPLGRALVGKLDGVWSTLRAVPGVIAKVRPIHERMIADVWKATQVFQPDITVFHQKLFFVPSFASVTGTRAAAVALVPTAVPTGQRPFWGMPSLPLGAAYNRATYGVLRTMSTLGTRGYLHRWRRAHDPQDRSIGSTPYRTADGREVPVLHAYSATVSPRPTDWPATARVTGYWRMPGAPEGKSPVPAGLRAFLDEGPTPVYVGFGSMAGLDPLATTHVVLEAVRLAGVRAVLALGWGGLRPVALPASVYSVEQVDHDWLLPRMAAAVHHGGAGTTAAALHAGIPSVVCPFGVDQPYWGRQIAALGAGPEPLPQKRLTAQSLARAISDVVERPTYRLVSQRLAETLRREDGVASAIREIDACLLGPPVRHHQVPA